MRITIVVLLCLVGSVVSGRRPCNPRTTAAPATANCARCARNLITILTANTAAKPFRSDVIGTAGNCATRTLTCAGTMANIEINRGNGVISDADDGNTDGLASLTVTCNAAGTGWVYQGVPITHVECASGV
ncbi:hypothetical protein PRIPAC_82689 [Pristionchus pacificus]|uniref:C6 domain-containing protein n=1 Tax=Pristionchus pacificus TaxID=54126 RepID=A0A454XIH3_PRIPA|nr:hypothetical protein PRIPAC_82689 [Pristionchus pacificus]|eukprot:PDM69959.1 hypothetical protein PRIPAC_49171 [Pristionchus pacificus]